MSDFQTFFGLAAIMSMILGVIFIFFDGMLLYSIAFFVIGMMIVLAKIMWGVAGWAENVTRKLGED
ncbi:MAG: hypothetical protein ISR81_06945 [Nitrosopumilus sp.]|nr:hypothetical protein [Nitrosopumilus sp.]